MAEDSGDKLGVYVSVPFCRAKCTFCNFASGVSAPNVIADYVEALCEEIASVRQTALRLGGEVPNVVDTLYLGGGTPSLLLPEQLSRIFGALRGEFAIAPDAEITLEAAPGQIADDVLEEALRLGTNRVSLGVQSFVDRECVAVGRSHTRESCLAEFARLRAAGVADVGADLIAGLPYQTAETWEESLRIAASADLTHLSVYMFEVDEDSRLGQEVASGGLRLHAPRVPDDDAVAGLYERACDALPRGGFAQYEISNFAKPGFESRHNRKYWERAPYVGFGLDAHSMLKRNEGAVRFANPDELKHYKGALCAREVTDVGLREAFEESLFLGLRMSRGVPVGSLREQYPSEWVDEAKSAAEELASEGLMSVCDQVLTLSGRGRLVSNEVFGHLLAGVAA